MPAKPVLWRRVDHACMDSREFALQFPCKFASLGGIFACALEDFFELSMSLQLDHVVSYCFRKNLYGQNQIAIFGFWLFLFAIPLFATAQTG